jgi:hypothetical protein
VTAAGIERGEAAAHSVVSNANGKLFNRNRLARDLTLF